MSKVTMTWELPEEQNEFMEAFLGWQWKSVVQEMDEWLRRQIKYSGKNEYEAVREALREMINDEGLSLWQ